MDNTKESPIILSICTGIRGLERGIERVIGPVRIAAYVEIEAFACWNLVATMESGILAPAPIWTDVKTFPSSEFHGRIHGVIGGYPCQPFSNAGNRRGEDDPRHLWPFIKQQISTIRPVWCFFENVAGHLTLGFESVKCCLEKMDYRVEAGIYSAEEVGAPHRRERLFILAVLADTSIQGLAKRRKQSAWEKQPLFERSSKTIPHPIRIYGKELQAQIRQSSIGRESIGNGHSGGIERFPSSRGEHQYDWEAPRTTQSSLGCTAHGYNFREDLLRALGNGVVEQTAELAFRDLLIKHSENGTEQNI